MTDLRMPDIARPCKRVVFQHTVGPLRGLMRIMGTTDEIPPTEPLPEFIADINITTPHARRTCASLIQVRHRLVIYREVIKTAKSRFGEHTSWDPLQK